MANLPSGTHLAIMCLLGSISNPLKSTALSCGFADFFKGTIMKGYAIQSKKNINFHIELRSKE